MTLMKNIDNNNGMYVRVEKEGFESDLSSDAIRRKGATCNSDASMVHEELVQNEKVQEKIICARHMLPSSLSTQEKVKYVENYSPQGCGKIISNNTWSSCESIPKIVEETQYSNGMYYPCNFLTTNDVWLREGEQFLKKL